MCTPPGPLGFLSFIDIQICQVALYWLHCQTIRRHIWTYCCAHYALHLTSPAFGYGKCLNAASVLFSPDSHSPHFLDDSEKLSFVYRFYIKKHTRNVRVLLIFIYASIHKNWFLMCFLWLCIPHRTSCPGYIVNIFISKWQWDEHRKFVLNIIKMWFKKIKIL